MKSLVALFALLCAVPALAAPAAGVTTCSDSLELLTYTRLDFVYGIPPSPEHPRPDWRVTWALDDEEFSRTDTLDNGQSTSTGLPVTYRFDDSTYRLIRFIPGNGHLEPSTWIYSIRLEFSAPLDEPLPAAIDVECTKVEGPPVP